MGGIENRTARNLWIKPKAQMKFLLLLAGGFVVLGAIAIYATLSFQAYLAQLQATNQIDTQTIILVSAKIDPLLRTVAGVAAVFAVLGFALGVMLTHRIYGPMVQIRKHVAKMNNGDYSGRIHLRNNDEFKDLATDLNALAERLNQKRGPS